MKKPNIWIFLIPPIVCVGIMIGVFIGRVTAGHTVQLQNPFGQEFSNADETEDKTAPESGIRQIDINTATAEELSILPGIGETLAKRIVDYREKNGPYESVKTLLKVEGIGEKKLQAILTYITAGGQP